MTRQEFIKSMAAVAALSGCSARDCRLAVGSCAKKRWYKGNLHTHTVWSDGKAFPEEAVAWYRSRGYNFLGLSDHNLFQDDTDRWVEIIGDKDAYTPPKKTGNITIIFPTGADASAWPSPTGPAARLPTRSGGRCLTGT